MNTSAAPTNDASWAIACFGIALPVVDELMESLAQQSAVRLRWFVFSEDMQRLGALVTHWQSREKLVVAAMPSLHGRLTPAAVSVLESEEVSLARCVWLQGSLVMADTPVGMGAALVWVEQSVDQVATQIAKFVGRAASGVDHPLHGC